MLIYGLLFYIDEGTLVSINANRLFTVTYLDGECFLKTCESCELSSRLNLRVDKLMHARTHGCVVPFTMNRMTIVSYMETHWR